MQKDPLTLIIYGTGFIFLPQIINNALNLNLPITVFAWAVIIGIVFIVAAVFFAIFPDKSDKSEIKKVSERKHQKYWAIYFHKATQQLLLKKIIGNILG